MNKFLVALALACVLAPVTRGDTDKLGKTPLYWLDFNGEQVQKGTGRLNFDPKRYEWISYWGRKGCCSFGDSGHGVSFKCGTGSFTLFAVAHGGNQYKDDDCIVFCLGPNAVNDANGTKALLLTIKDIASNDVANGADSNSICVKSWDTDNTSARNVIEAHVSGCYAGYRYVPYAIVYDAVTTKLTLYANGEAIGSAQGDFTGMDRDECHWQIASVRGGAKGGKRDGVGVTDFRYYTEALTAEQIQAISADYPLSDQSGEMPYYHYAFDGSGGSDQSGSIPVSSNLVQMLGCERLRNNKGGYNQDSNAHFFLTDHSEDVVRDGRYAAKGFVGSTTYGNYWPLTNSFTFVISAKMNSEAENDVLFAFGSKGNSAKAACGSLAIVSRAKGKIGLDTWDTSLNRIEGLTVDLCCATTDHLHTYAIVHDRDAKTMTLYVDGGWCGTMAHDGFSVSDAVGVHGCWAFTSPHGGSSHFATTASSTVEEFRFYNKILSREQIVAVSDALPHWRAGGEDSLGLIPHLHSHPQGNAFVHDGHPLRPASGKIFPFSTIEPIRGGTSVAGLESRSPDFEGDGFPTNRPFTVFVSANAGYGKNATLFSVGNIKVGGVALTHKDTDGTTVAAANYKDGSTGLTPQTATVAGGASGTFHAYAWTVDPLASTMQLYVDGDPVGNPVKYDYPIGSRNWQFCGTHGGTTTVTSENYDMGLEDFRVYIPALTSEQVAALSAEYPPWTRTDETETAPAYWYRYRRACGCEILGTRALFSDNSVQNLAGGNTPIREHGVACSNVVAANNFGNAGGVVFADKFSIFLSARVRRSTDKGSNAPAVVFGFGSQVKGDTETLALVSEVTNAISCYSFIGSAKKRLVSADVPNMEDNFNAYCVTWDGSVMTLYVNGELKASATPGDDFTGFTSGPKWQICGFHGGYTSGFVPGRANFEEFRIYDTALTPEQVGAVSAAFPSWPNGRIWTGGSTGSWGDSVWQWWNWTADGTDGWGAWTVGTLPAGADVVFDTSAETVTLAGSMTPAAGKITVRCPVELAAGSKFECSALAFEGEGSLKPAGVSGLLSPGVKVAKPAEMTGVDFSKEDQYGNHWYLSRGGALFYGDGTCPGFLLMFR